MSASCALHELAKLAVHGYRPSRPSKREGGREGGRERRLEGREPREAKSSQEGGTRSAIV